MNCRGHGIHGARDETSVKAIRMSKLLKGELTKQIIGAFPQVHYELGAGFLESVSANAIALCGPGLQVEREVPLVVCFRRHGVGSPAHQEPPRQSARVGLSLFSGLDR